MFWELSLSLGIMLPSWGLYSNFGKVFSFLLKAESIFVLSYSTGTVRIDRESNFLKLSKHLRPEIPLHSQASNNQSKTAITNKACSYTICIHTGTLNWHNYQIGMEKQSDVDNHHGKRVPLATFKKPYMEWIIFRSVVCPSRISVTFHSENGIYQLKIFTRKL